MPHYSLYFILSHLLSYFPFFSFHNRISGIRAIFSLSFLNACPCQGSGYGSRATSSWGRPLFLAKRPPMEEEKRDDEERDPFKMLLKEAIA
jgi:hypothetical protein